jgi:acetyl-CoA C-acetyltransferase
MTEAFILDAVRTPRGKGRASGALHEIGPARLAAGLPSALRELAATGGRYREA